MFYKFLEITIGTAIRIFFRESALRNEENIPAGKPVIFVSNHPSAFMDPLVLGILAKRPLYYFARADIFTSKFVKWITEKAHMSPIYRSVDGMDSLEKNDAVFSHGYKLLSEKKFLLLFGEGFTDEEFVRRVKPMKKGSMRIALGAEHKFDFKLGVNIVCVGINYSDPRKFRSDVLLSFSKPIEVSEYKNLFMEHNNKAMFELNKEIYSRLKEQVVHIENTQNDKLFEQLLVISGKGISHENFDGNYSIKERWEFSKELADAINSIPDENLKSIREKVDLYFQLIEKNKIEYSHIEKTQHLFFVLFYLVIMFPVFVLGIVNNYMPAKLSTFLSRKISKRPVFWSGTDMAFSILTIPVYYFLIIYLVQSRTGNIYVTLIYSLLMPLTGLAAFDYIRKFKALKFKRDKKMMESLELKKRGIIEEMQKLFGGG